MRPWDWWEEGGLALEREREGRGLKRWRGKGKDVDGGERVDEPRSVCRCRRYRYS